MPLSCDVAVYCARVSTVQCLCVPLCHFATTMLMITVMILTTMMMVVVIDGHDHYDGDDADADAYGDDAAVGVDGGHDLDVVRNGGKENDDERYLLL